MKHRIIYFVVLVAAIGALFAPGTNSFSQKEVFPVESNISGTWKLMPVLASDTASGKLAILQFNTSANSFIGNTGCNSISGKFNMSGNMLSFSEQEITTKNVCPGYNEEAFVANLLKVNHFKIENGVLELMVDQTVLSKWVRKEPLNAIKAI
ncbi:MAG TPA: META domain-containing protein [Chitinophagaceae bacterium]|nr:META domain-containing protein [Chitinophagaceae bacterium]